MRVKFFLSPSFFITILLTILPEIGFSRYALFHQMPTAVTPTRKSVSPRFRVFGDTTRPQISGITISKLTISTATISWRTDENATAQVEYGLTLGYGSWSKLDTSLSTSHAITLTGLLTDTIYHFRVLSKNATGNLAAGKDSSFVTPMRAAPLYSPFEVQLTSTRRYNIPYVEAKVTGIFISPTGKELRLDGFWDGGQIWRVRFAPNEIGAWTFHTESDDPELLTSGRFNALPTTRQGFVRVSKVRPYQFEYSDGTPFLLMGDTNWDAMSSGVGFETRFKPYIDLRRSQNFNAYHTIVVNNRLDYQSNEGGMPYAMFDPETRDYNRLNPDYFKWVDKRVAYADSMGMVSILFFTWAHEIAKMSTADYQRLALYIVSRYAAYNVFWILAGDYQVYFYEPELYRQVGNAVAAADPFDHPISIHPADGYVNREFAKEPWLSYVMHQLRDAGEFLADSIRFDHIYNKPVVNGEYGYHVPESVHPYHGIRQDANFTRTGGWSIFAAGGYFVTGFEHTYLDPNGYYPYDPGFDTPLLFWDLNDAADLEAARQFSVLFRFFRDHTNWTDLEPHPELVLDGQSVLLANPGVEYVAYNVRGGRMRLRLPIAQHFSLSWFNPISGVLDPPSIFEAADETILITPPDTLDAVALLRPATPLSFTPAGVVEGLHSEQLNVRQVSFRWTTPEPADSRIDIQQPDGTLKRFIDTRIDTQHELIVDGVLPGIKYKLVVSSQTNTGKIWKTMTECLLTSTVVLDQFIEAETMPTKTVGHAEPPGWNLDTEGFLAMPINFPQTGAYRFEIRGRGEYRKKIWPQLTLSIDNGNSDTLTINSAVFRLFQHELHITAGTHTLALAFTNPGDDRQLIIDQLHVQFIDTSAAPPPVIAGIAVTNLMIASATLNWKTGTPTETKIEYGTSSNYGAFTPLAFCRDTTHVFTLAGLTPSTTYYFRVHAKDAAGKLAVSRDTTFTTLADLQPPLIANIVVTKVTATSATITWSTDEPSTSQAEFGLDASYGYASTINSALDKQHEVTLLNLASSKTFHARVKSTDMAGNTAMSPDFTFATLSAVDRLAIVSGDAQLGAPGKLLAAPLVVKVLDITGIAVSNVDVAFQVISGGGRIIGADSCSGSACIIATKPDGIAAVNWELGPVGPQIIEASVVERPDLVVRFAAQVDLTGVPSEENQSLPATFALRQHPNPFREAAQFEVALPVPGHVSLKIFDVQGREVVALFDGAKTAGRFSLNWNGRDQSSREIAAGIYFAVLRYETKASSGAAQIFTEKRQVVYLK
jgi:Protein of unknown function (DUF4038)/Domain of unknown function (DUF5060)/Purple acid Phosphatase, N-terminal domain